MLWRSIDPLVIDADAWAGRAGPLGPIDGVRSERCVAGSGAWGADDLPRSGAPILIARGRVPASAGTILVGLDASPASAAALQFACDEAAAGAAHVTLVHAVVPGTSAAEHRRALGWLGNVVAATQADTGVVVEGRVIDGWPGPVLAGAAHDADVVTVGSRGVSGFRARSLGSVARYLARCSPCPVLVHHPPRLC